MDKGSVKLALSIISAEFARLEEQGRRSRERRPGSERSRLGNRGSCGCRPRSHSGEEGVSMRIGIATDHGGFGLKEDLLGKLKEADYEVIDFRRPQFGVSRRLSGFCYTAGAVRRGR